MTPSSLECESASRLGAASRGMGRLCTVLMATLPVAVAWYWAASDAPTLAAWAKLPGTAVAAPLQTWQRLAAALICAAALAPWLAGLWQARQCFRLFARGPVFTLQAVRYLRHFAAWALVAAVAGVVAGTAVSALLTWPNPPGQRYLAVSIGSDQVLTMFVAGMVWLMAAVIGHGQALAEENASFV